MGVTKKHGFGSMPTTESKKYYENMYEKLESSRSVGVHTRSPLPVSTELLNAVDRYITECYLPVHQCVQGSSHWAKTGILDRSKIKTPKHAALPSGSTLDDILEKLDEPFAQTLMRLVDTKGKTDVEIYTRANLDRRLYSKIKSDKQYRPGKRTVLALAVALELNLHETEDFLKRVGFAFSHSQKFDIIVEYFIINGKYDIFEINEVLFRYDQPLLGG